jgi:hypothetical protein
MNHAKKHHQRTIDKINLLVRLELDNPQLSSTQVALLCGLSINRFSVLKASPLYQTIHNQYMTGLLTSFDTKIKNGYSISQETLDFAVPIAMQGLVKQALTVKDERVKNKAFNDILDRDGRFAKVSRIGMTVNEQGSIAEDKDNKAVLEMIHALNSKPKTATISTPPLTETTQ